MLTVKLAVGIVSGMSQPNQKQDEFEDEAIHQAFVESQGAIEERLAIKAEMIEVIAEGIKQLRQPIYGLVHVTDHQAEERARNIAAHLRLMFNVTRSEP
jgi:hypothetical protein